MVKETKLYDTLGVQPTATQDEIKKGYRKKAIATHPDKNKNNPKAAEEFKEVGQAYEILSNPETRRDYDTFGLEYVLSGGQKGGAPPPHADSAGRFPGFGSDGTFPGMNGGGRQFHFSTGGGNSGFSFTDPESLFSSFFAEQGGSPMAEGLFAGMEGLGSGRSPFGSGRGAKFRDPHKRAAAPEIQAVEKDLPVTLEQLFRGDKKKLKISRKTFDPQTGKRKVEEKPLEVEIRAGYKEGTKIKYKGWGHQEEGGVQDLHFVIKQKPHERFVRDGDDLRTTVEIGLKEALTGWERTVSNIEGRQMRITAPAPTQPGYEIHYPDQGMPKSKKPDQRGEMIVEVKVKFPTTLTSSQKQQLLQVL